jgi:hypothetical protein
MRDDGVKRFLLHDVPFRVVFRLTAHDIPNSSKPKFLQSLSAHVIAIFSSIFSLQKSVIRMNTNIRRRDSCREQFKQILPLQLQYILYYYL